MVETEGKGCHGNRNDHKRGEGRSRRKRQRKGKYGGGGVEEKKGMFWGWNLELGLEIPFLFQMRWINDSQKREINSRYGRSTQNRENVHEKIMFHVFLIYFLTKGFESAIIVRFCELDLQQVYPKIQGFWAEKSGWYLSDPIESENNRNT